MTLSSHISFHVLWYPFLLTTTISFHVSWLLDVYTSSTCLNRLDRLSCLTLCMPLLVVSILWRDQSQEWMECNLPWHLFHQILWWCLLLQEYYHLRTPCPFSLPTRHHIRMLCLLVVLWVILRQDPSLPTPSPHLPWDHPMPVARLRYHGSMEPPFTTTSIRYGISTMEWKEREIKMGRRDINPWEDED